MRPQVLRIDGSRCVIAPRPSKLPSPVLVDRGLHSTSPALFATSSHSPSSCSPPPSPYKTRAHSAPSCVFFCQRPIRERERERGRRSMYLTTRDEMLMTEWLTAEFAAANAMIDVLCGHLVRMGGHEGYRAALDAIQRRRVAWFPLIHMQEYYPIGDVAAELSRVADGNRPMMARVGDRNDEEIPVTKGMVGGGGEGDSVDREEKREEDDDNVEEGINEGGAVEGTGEDVREEEQDKEGGVEQVDDDDTGKKSNDCPGGDSSTDQRKIAGMDGCAAPAGKNCVTSALHDDNADLSHEPTSSGTVLFSEDGDSPTQSERTKNCKRFVAKETVKGHMVNVVKGLKLYEDVLTDMELSRLDGFTNELLVAGRSGELTGDTYILFNKRLKGNKREIIQLGVPMFQPTTEEPTSKIEPIPSVLRDLINHLVRWRVIPESRKPNSCIINFFDEEDHSQPYLKPPHLENPISTLFLRETEIAFGRVLVSDQDGDFKGSLRLSLKEGSLLVMRGHSADMARHVVCPLPRPRVSITFAKVRLTTGERCAPPQPAATVVPSPTAAPVVGALATGMVPTWGMGMTQQLQGPVVMVAPPQGNARNPVLARDGRGNRPGTGVFLPWTLGPKKHVKQIPPRIQKRRLPAMPPLVQTQMQVPSQQTPCFVI